ncbi:MAG: NUDIX hydrolase [Actinomycetota bacterium]|nr:NUDIX hydrolase [Actinomycetota bacterium]
MALRADHVVMPSGSIAKREVLEHPGAVAIVPLDAEQRVVLIHQYRHPLGRALWELPAGLLDIAGEEPVETARRELAEEVGIAATDWSVLLDLAPSPGFSDESVRVFLARGLSEVTRPAGADNEEADLEIHRVPLHEAVHRVLSGEIVNSSTAAGLLATHAVVTAAAQPRPIDTPWRDRPTQLAARRGC